MKKSRELLENLLKQLFFSDLPDMSVVLYRFLIKSLYIKTQPHGF